MKIEKKRNIDSTKKLRRVILLAFREKKDSMIPSQLKLRKVGDSIEMSWKAFGRLYLETDLKVEKLFGPLEDVKDNIALVLSRIEETFKGVNIERLPNRQERRNQLRNAGKKGKKKISYVSKERAKKRKKQPVEIKKTIKPMKNKMGYFRAKNKLSLNDWMDIVARNIEHGKRMDGMTRKSIIEMNEAFLVYRENKYRELLTLQLGYTKEKAEKAIEDWYNTVIKDNSFMMEK